MFLVSMAACHHQHVSQIDMFPRHAAASRSSSARRWKHLKSCRLQVCLFWEAEVGRRSSSAGRGRSPPVGQLMVFGPETDPSRFGWDEKNVSAFSESKSRPNFSDVCVCATWRFRSSRPIRLILRPGEWGGLQCFE